MFTSEACDMNATMNDPDLHLQCFNDHGIFTIDELNLLSKTVKPQLSALHLNVRSFNQHFDESFLFITLSLRLCWMLGNFY